MKSEPLFLTSFRQLINAPPPPPSPFWCFFSQHQCSGFFVPRSPLDYTFERTCYPLINLWRGPPLWYLPSGQKRDPKLPLITVRGSVQLFFSPSAHTPLRTFFVLRIVQGFPFSPDSSGISKGTFSTTTSFFPPSSAAASITGFLTLKRPGVSFFGPSKLFSVLSLVVS